MKRRCPTRGYLLRLREQFADGQCLEAADEILHRFGGRLLYVVARRSGYAGRVPCTHVRYSNHYAHCRCT